MDRIMGPGDAREPGGAGSAAYRRRPRSPWVDRRVPLHAHEAGFDLHGAVHGVLHGAADPVSPKSDRDAFEAEMDAAGARWYQLVFGRVVHSYTDPHANSLPVSKYDEAATRHSYTLAHAFIEDAFAGRL